MRILIKGGILMKIFFDNDNIYDVDIVDQFEVISSKSYESSNKSIFLINKDGENMYLIPTRTYTLYTCISQHIISSILKYTAKGILNTEEQVCQMYHLCGGKKNIFFPFIFAHKCIDKLSFDDIKNLYVPKECTNFEEKHVMICESLE